MEVLSIGRELKYSTEKTRQLRELEYQQENQNSRSYSEELILQRNKVLVVCNNGHGQDLHVFSDVISRTNKYKAPPKKWNLMNLRKGLDDVIMT